MRVVIRVPTVHLWEHSYLSVVNTYLYKTVTVSFLKLWFPVAIPGFNTRFKIATSNPKPLISVNQLLSSVNIPDFLKNSSHSCFVCYSRIEITKTRKNGYGCHRAAGNWTCISDLLHLDLIGVLGRYHNRWNGQKRGCVCCLSQRH